MLPNFCYKDGKGYPKIFQLMVKLEVGSLIKTDITKCCLENCTIGREFEHFKKKCIAFDCKIVYKRWKKDTIKNLFVGTVWMAVPKRSAHENCTLIFNHILTVKVKPLIQLKLLRFIIK